MLDIIEHEVGERQDVLKMLPGHVPCRLHGGVDVRIVTRPEYAERELRLGQRFTTRKRHAASRSSVVGGVFPDPIQDVAHCHLFAYQTQSTRWALSSTLPTLVTQGLLHLMTRFHLQVRVYGTAVTGRQASATPDAPAFEEFYLRLGILRFGVATPEAPHGTALEKNDRPDPRTIVDGVPLNV